MQLINKYFTGPDSLDALAGLVPPDGGDRLVQIFTRSREPAVVRRLISAARARLPAAHVVGMTGYGTILNADISRRNTLFSVLVADQTTFRAAAEEASDSTEAGVQALGRRLARQVTDEQTRCLLVFTNFDAINPCALLDGVHQVCPGLPVAGGIAGQDPDNPGPTLVWCDETVTDRGAVIVALSGADLDVHQAYNLGVATMGQVFRVTRCTGHWLMELDGEPMVDVYRRYLGEQVALDLPRSVLGFPLVVERHGTEVALDALEVDPRGAIRYDLPLHEGEYARFGFPHAERMLNGAAALAERMGDHGTAEALLIYMCASHLWTLNEGAASETAMLRGIGPIAGCLTGGEFQQVGGVYQCLHQTMTVLMLRERPGTHRWTTDKLPAAHSVSHVNVHLRAVKVLHGMVSRMTDELENANRRLQRERAFYRTLIEEMLDGLALLDAECRCIYQSPSNRTIHGWSRGEPDTGTNVIDALVHPDDQARVYGLWQQILARPGGRARLTARIRHRDGHWITIEAQNRNCLHVPDVAAVITYFRDITEIQRLETELRRLATTDSLTMLPNRRFFLERARQEQHRAARNGTCLSVLIMDIDHFKRVNDTHGHAAGDQVLVGLGELLRAGMRDQDVAGRLGGEEFAVLLPDTDSAGAVMLAERLRAAVESHRIKGVADHPLQITASLGVASLTAGRGSVDELLARADEALYRAKKAGRNCVCTD